MKIQYCSDLHLEFQANYDFIEQYPIIPKGEILILAGDIFKFKMMKPHNDFVDFISDQFEMVYWLPGNHEYYGSDMNDKAFVLNEKIRENVFLVNNVALIWKDVEFVFSTLWTHIGHEKEDFITRSLSDFHTIRIKGERFLPHDYNSLHNQCKCFIETAIAKKTDRLRVVVTHHVPTLLNYPVKYAGDILNQAFVVPLDDLINRSNASYWIYGHHHFNIPEFSIGNTKILTNQLGYVHKNEHLTFRRDAVVEITSL